MNSNKINSKMLGISLPNEVLLKIDKDRGPIPRSTIPGQIDRNSI